jgi:hypothetical protein
MESSSEGDGSTVRRDTAMTSKRSKLPKEGLVEPESKRRLSDDGGDDVEGHRLPTTAPPAAAARGHEDKDAPSPTDEGLSPRTPGHGGE